MGWICWMVVALRLFIAELLNVKLEWQYGCFVICGMSFLLSCVVMLLWFFGFWLYGCFALVIIYGLILWAMFVRLRLAWLLVWLILVFSSLLLDGCLVYMVCFRACGIMIDVFVLYIMWLILFGVASCFVCFVVCCWFSGCRLLCVACWWVCCYWFVCVLFCIDFCVLIVVVYTVFWFVIWICFWLWWFCVVLVASLV